MNDRKEYGNNVVVFCKGRYALDRQIIYEMSLGYDKIISISMDTNASSPEYILVMSKE